MQHRVIKKFPIPEVEGYNIGHLQFNEKGDLVIRMDTENRNPLEYAPHRIFFNNEEVHLPPPPTQLTFQAPYLSPAGDLAIYQHSMSDHINHKILYVNNEPTFSFLEDSSVHVKGWHKGFLYFSTGLYSKTFCRLEGKKFAYVPKEDWPFSSKEPRVININPEELDPSNNILDLPDDINETGIFSFYTKRGHQVSFHGQTGPAFDHPGAIHKSQPKIIQSPDGNAIAYWVAHYPGWAKAGGKLFGTAAEKFSSVDIKNPLLKTITKILVYPIAFPIALLFNPYMGPGTIAIELMCYRQLVTHKDKTVTIHPRHYLSASPQFFTKDNALVAIISTMKKEKLWIEGEEGPGYNVINKVIQTEEGDIFYLASNKKEFLLVKVE